MNCAAATLASVSEAGAAEPPLLDEKLRFERVKTELNPNGVFITENFFKIRLQASLLENIFAVQLIIINHVSNKVWIRNFTSKLLKNFHATILLSLSVKLSYVKLSIDFTFRPPLAVTCDMMFLSIISYFVLSTAERKSVRKGRLSEIRSSETGAVFRWTTDGVATLCLNFLLSLRCFS
jgi:hypothetical protein